MQTHDVIVVGAGLAGLRCALELARAGRDVVVLEASSRVGGRQRSDRVDGFLLDRGFHVLNPAYPALRMSVDVPALRLRPFPVGVRVQRGTGSATLAHPLRHPQLIPATLRSGLMTPASVRALLRWLAPAVRPHAMTAHSDTTLAEAWDAAMLDGPLRDEVLGPFLSGVLADDRGETSNAYVLLLMRLFALARPGVPADGIAALPAQLAHRADAAGADVRLDRRVRKLKRRGDQWEVVVRGERAMRARDVVVAVGPEAVARFTPLDPPATRGLQTWWFAADAPPDSALLTLDGTADGPIVNTLAMSLSAPSYAPAGRHLVQATCLLGPSFSPTQRDVRDQLVGLWGRDAATWELLRRDDLPHALPALPPPLKRPSPSHLGDGLHVAGDHRDTPSIQGALGSGERAARGVLGRRS
jgi:phytoene dehydrogenase-like protein